MKITIEVDEVPKNFTGMAEHSNGDKFWYKNDLMHRLDGPAIEFANGAREWWLNDKRHRLDGPACEYPNGTKEWCKNGKLHREDGPAIEYPDGSKYWYLDGKEYSERVFNEEIQKRKNQSNPCNGKVVEIDGKKYKLVLV